MTRIKAGMPGDRAGATGIEKVIEKSARAMPRRAPGFAVAFAVGLAACGGDEASVPAIGGASVASGGAETAAGGWVGEAPAGAWTGAMPLDPAPQEAHIASLQRLTHGGTNAEAYFSPDGERLIFQSTWPSVTECDQVYTMRLDGSDLQRVSTGEGRTTCGYFFPGRDLALFSSTHLIDAMCPPAPDRSRGYLWGLFEYDVFTRDLVTGEVRRLTETPGYDAEATISPDGSTIIFTSLRDGDLNLWAMDADGSNPRQLTTELGYQGGAFYSADGSRIVYRAHIPRDDAERADYLDLLDQGLVRGGRLEVFVMDADGSNIIQVTDNGASNFAPFFHPDGERIIFSSNLHNPGGRYFDLFMINVDGTGLTRITWNEQGFDGFPMFSADGRYLAFASDRGGSAPGEINVFLAEWQEAPAALPTAP